MTSTDNEYLLMEDVTGPLLFDFSFYLELVDFIELSLFIFK